MQSAYSDEKCVEKNFLIGIHILTMHYYVAFPVFSQYIDNTDVCLQFSWYIVGF